MDIPEVKITINGSLLSSGQAMAVRVAISSFHMKMSADRNALGNDEHGRAMVKGYRERLGEVLRLII